MEFKQGNKFEGDDMIFDENSIEIYHNNKDNWKSVKLMGATFIDIPKDWEMTKLKDVSSDPLYGMNSASTMYDGVNKYLRITDIDDETRKLFNKGYTSPLEKTSEKFKVNIGDIVFARTGASVGKSFICNENVPNLFFAGFLIKFPITMCDYNLVYLQTFGTFYNKWVKVMSVRTGQPGINSSEFGLLPIKLPSSKTEQSKIAFVIIQQQNYINELKTQKINKVKEKQYFTQEELSGRLRIRLTGKSMTELVGLGILGNNLNVIEGKEQELDDWLSNGFDDKVEFYLNRDDNWGNVKVNGRMVDVPLDWDVEKNKSLYTKNIKSKLTAKKGVSKEGNIPFYNCSRTQTLFSNESLSGQESILLSTGGLPSIHYVNKEHSYSTDVLSIYISNNAKFYYYYFKNKMELLENSFHGAGLQHLSKPLFDKLELLIPSKPEQTLVSTHLTMYDDLIEDIDTKINIEETKLKYLTNELLSGRLRVR